MKTIQIIPILLIVSLLTSCTETVIGPQGPQGIPGPEGPIGAPGESGFVFEYENINFTSGNGYEVILPYYDGFEGYDSDVALVYLLWGVDNEGVEIWRKLDQQILFEGGDVLLYKYDFTKFDVRLFLDATFPLSELSAIDTDEWVARIVVVPGDFWQAARVDASDYYAIEEALGLPELRTTHDNQMDRK
ncbi:collagen-like protein [Marinoscillum sp. MHG1-6]|uniref:collagen-like triple helix repeat-containing protein n=1 Tax=Marinoscillum sp. MHG1-6 TaxID=2959627 RepID=UPI0021577CA5|nr:collagen-like protein [Marinoscillum sp. MHG1-6]